MDDDVAADMPYRMSEISSLILDNERWAKSYFWALTIFMPQIRGKRDWNSNYLRESLSSFVSVSDEAFMLINLENQWNRWYDMYCTGNTKVSPIGTIYTSMGVDANNNNRPRQLCNKFGGWNAAGMAAFNRYSSLIKIMRKRRSELEETWRTAWNDESELTISKKRKRSVQRAETIETAFNDLFPSDDEDDDDEEERVMRAANEARYASIGSTNNVTPQQPPNFAEC